jgi:hypothetical protein
MQRLEVFFYAGVLHVAIVVPKIKLSNALVCSYPSDVLDELNNEVVMLKNVQRTQAQVLRSNKHEWEAERKELVDEKRKLEYDIYDMLQVNFANKEKLKRIRAICDE